MPVRGLTIVLATPDVARFRTALGMAAAQAALGGNARLFLDHAAVPLAAVPTSDDRAYHTAGMPTLAELIDTCFALGVRIVVCQSGLTLAGISASAIDLRFEAGGMTGVLAQLGDDRLVAL